MGGATDTLLASALDLASRGLRVFPLKPGTKLPAIKDWPNLATTDEAQIRRVWDGRPWNIGVAMGQGFLGLDVDMKNGKDGLASLAALGVELNGFVVRTPTGGKHGYFIGPDVSNSAGRLGAGLDVRGAGGFLVGPASRVEAGEYTIERADGFGPVPPVIVQRCVAPVERRVEGPDLDDAGRQSAEDRGRAYLATAEPAVEGAGGDDTTYRVVARLKDFGVSVEAAFDLMAEHWNDRCSPPWDLEDLKTKVANAYEYGTSPIGIAHPAVDFAGFKKVEAPAEPETSKPSSWFRHGDAKGKVNWLYRNMLPSVGVGVLVAPSQAGKTFLAIELARSLATGSEFFRQEPKDMGGTLFVFAGTEGSGLALRLDALQEPERLPISATTIGNLAEPKALQHLLEALKEEAAYILATHGVPVRLVVLETMAASGLLIDENSNSEASRAMANLAQISRAMNALVLTSHHPAKAGNGTRGASAIPASADYVIEIIRHEQAAVREVALTKARDAEQRRLGSFTLIPVDLGVDEDGEPVTSMVLSMGAARVDLSRPPPYMEAFLRAAEWGCDEGEDIGGGRKAISVDDARLMFRDLKTGSKDRSNYGKAFAKCQTFAEAAGRVVTEPFDGKPYLIWKAPIEAPGENDE